jgi:hypothetical protein
MQKVLKKMKNSLWKRILPLHYRRSITSYIILSKKFGHMRSIKEKACIDADGNPLPWYCYSAIEFLNQLDFRDKVVFEYGSGYGTLFWAQKAKRVTAVEDNREWYEKMKSKAPANVKYLFRPDKTDYVNAISDGETKFDIVVIDGSHRFECGKLTIESLAPDGFVILDNSDSEPETSKILRDADLIEIDMRGFGPINEYTWSTSFYLSRKVHLKSLHDRQPIKGIGTPSW